MLQIVYDSHMKPEPMGTVGLTKARLYNNRRELIAFCMDTPNAIAKAFMELSEARAVKTISRETIQFREDYQERMKSWNTVRSDLMRV